jgi:hypothetical protein
MLPSRNPVVLARSSKVTRSSVADLVRVEARLCHGLRHGDTTRRAVVHHSGSTLLPARGTARQKAGTAIHHDGQSPRYEGLPLGW